MNESNSFRMSAVSDMVLLALETNHVAVKSFTVTFCIDLIIVSVGISVICVYMYLCVYMNNWGQ